MGTVEISKEEYDELLNFKKLILDLEDKLHKSDSLYNVAKKVSKDIYSKKQKIFNELEVL